MYVAGTKGAAFQVAELVEHEQGMIAGTAEMTVVDPAFLITVGRADRTILVEHGELRRAAVMSTPGESVHWSEAVVTRRKADVPPECEPISGATYMLPIKK